MLAILEVQAIIKKQKEFSGEMTVSGLGAHVSTQKDPEYPNMEYL